MMRGWFDAFRENGGPTLYSYTNRTPVTADVSTLTLYIVFVTLFLAFLIIFPGVRRQRFTTFTSVALSLFVGTAILGQYRNFRPNQSFRTLRVTFPVNNFSFELSKVAILNRSRIFAAINLPWGHVSCHKKLGPNRFRLFWDTDRQT